MELGEMIVETAVELLRRASTQLPKPYIEAMEGALEEMEGEVGRAQLANILENVRMGAGESMPICQDTGIVAFLIELGDGFPLRSRLKELLVEATRRATREVPLRPNAVDLFQGNTGDNVGLQGHVPLLYIDLVEGDELRLTAMPKGGGSSNVAAHAMLKPGVDLRGVKEFILEAVARAGSLGCPPYFIGVGIGGGEDYCMLLAKKGLLRPLGVRHPDPRVAEMEVELLEKINQLGIGVMGLGEGPTALDVHIEIGARHPASLPVGVVLSCWALRHATAIISADGEVSWED